MTDQNSQMNQLIRAAAGRQSPQELAAAAIAAAERAGEDGDLRTRVAVEAGLPAEMGSRLRGDDAGQLAEDAAELAQTLDASPPRTASQTLSDQIRAAAGRGPAPDETAGDGDRVSLDGGARQSTSPPEPSPSALIRGELAERQERRAELARDLDN